MSQSDYNIGANPSGLNMRTEINQIFDSILTNNSGSTAPTVTSAFMMWVDTSNATYYYLKMRNHDNTAWVTLFIYTVSTKVITPFIINSPTTNAIPKINADGTIKSSSVIEEANGNLLVGTTTDNGVDKLQVNGSISSKASNYTNLNTITVNGGFITTSGFFITGCLNAPPINYGTVTQVSLGDTSCSQLSIDVISGRMFTRGCSGGTWYAWVEK